MTPRVLAVAVLFVLAGALLFIVLAGCGVALPAFEPAASVPPVTVQPANPAPVEPPVGVPVGVPVAMAIPKLGVTDEVIPVGLAQDNAMEVPPVDKVGWYRLAPKPGERGPGVLAGHVNYSGVQGAFSRLAELKTGDQVTVTDNVGVKRIFAVYDVRTVLKSDYMTRTVPLVFGARTTSDLVLVTCGGRLDGHEYLSNVIASARLVPQP